MAQNIKEQIIAWFNSPQDFDQGMELLKKVSKKHRIIGKLIKRGESRSSYSKLVYELNKVAGLKKIPVPQVKIDNKLGNKVLPALGSDKKEIPPKTQKKDDTPKKETMNLAGKQKGDLSPVMQRVVKENSTLCMQRGKKHSALVKLSDDNSEETREKRLKLMDEIEKMTNRIEILFVAWTEYNKKKTEPDPAVLWPDEFEKKQGDITSEMSVEDMKREKKNLQSSITKDRNLLLYGSKTKPEDGKTNQMPEKSPMRIKLEKRIAKKEVLIEDLDRKIAEKE